MRLEAIFEKGGEKANEIDYADCGCVPAGSLAEIVVHFKDGLPSSPYFPTYIVFKEGGEFSIEAKPYNKEMPNIYAKGISNSPVSVEVIMQVGENNKSGMPENFDTRVINIANTFSEPSENFRQFFVYDGCFFTYEKDHRYNEHNLNNPNNPIRKYYLRKTSSIEISYQKSNLSKDFFEKWIAPLQSN